MALALKVEGDLYVQGRILCDAINLPADTVQNLQVASTTPLTPDKVTSQRTAKYAQKSATTAAADAEVIYVARASGTLKTFRAGCVIANIGDSTITVDLKKNGTTVLSAPISLTSAHAAYQQVVGTIPGGSVSFVAGDVFEVVVAVSAGTGTLGKGVFAQLNYNENNLP